MEWKQYFRRNDLKYSTRIVSGWSGGNTEIYWAFQTDTELPYAALYALIESDCIKYISLLYAPIRKGYAFEFLNGLWEHMGNPHALYGNTFVGEGAEELFEKHKRWVAEQQAIGA